MTDHDSPAGTRGSNASERQPPTATVRASGHANVTSAHESTFEIATDDYLTPAGDCIVGIEADQAPAAFPETFVDACTRQSARITITLDAAGHTDTVEALGSPELTFESERSAVVRTSDYIDDRTVAIAASKSAGDLDRDLVDALADGADLTVELAVDR
jgi:hypothetical protein